MDLGAIAMKGYSTFPKAPALVKPHHQIVKCHILDIRCGGGLTPRQSCSQLTGQQVDKDFSHVLCVQADRSFNSSIYSFIHLLT